MPLVMIKSDPCAREKPCLRCGYSLRKNLDAKHCPECGLSVWLSLNGNDALDSSNPAWLTRLTAASVALSIAQAAGLLMWVGLDPAIGRLLPWRADLVTAVVQLIGGMHFLGYSLGLATLALPERRYPDRLKAFRWAAWVVAAAGMLVGLTTLAVGVRGTAAFLSKLPLHFLLLLEVLAAFAYLNKLARRVPNSLLARLCGYLMLLPVLSFAKSFPIFAFLLAFQAMAVLAYLPWAYLPISMGLLLWFVLIFRRAATSAQSRWDEETGPDFKPRQGSSR